MTAERLSELGPLVVGSMQQVLCPLANIECGGLVGGIVLIWLDKEGCGVRRIDVAYAEMATRQGDNLEPVDDGVLGAEYRRIDTVSLNKPSWQDRLVVEGQTLEPDGVEVVREVLAEVVPLQGDVAIFAGEAVRQRRSLMLPFAAFPTELPTSLPVVQLDSRMVRLFDFLIDASIADIVRFVHMQYANGLPRRRHVARNLPQVLSGYRPDPRVLRRHAAGAYLSTAIRVATATGWSGTHLFETIDDLSRMRHEKTAAAGHLAFVSKRLADEVCLVRLYSDVLQWVSDASSEGQPIVSELRIVRKLLHGTTPDWLLVISDGIPVGWAPRQRLAESTEAVLISFKRPGKWYARFREQEFLAVLDGQVQRSADVSPYLLVDAALQVVRPLGHEWDQAYITDVTSEVAEAEHGALLVFMDKAAEYVRTHQHSCIPVEPARIDPHAVASAAMMDGALVFDTKGRCHAVAAILDGESCGSERIDRGARYNAALRFCARNAAAICVVTSDDGLINVLAGREESG